MFAYPWLPSPMILLSYFSSGWAKIRDILTLPLKSPLSAIQLEELQSQRIHFREHVAKVTVKELLLTWSAMEDTES